jgi:hypothetical protein
MDPPSSRRAETWDGTRQSVILVTPKKFVLREQAKTSTV